MKSIIHNELEIRLADSSTSLLILGSAFVSDRYAGHRYISTIHIRFRRVSVIKMILHFPKYTWNNCWGYSFFLSDRGKLKARIKMTWKIREKPPGDLIQNHPLLYVFLPSPTKDDIQSIFLSFGPIIGLGKNSQWKYKEIKSKPHAVWILRGIPGFFSKGWSDYTNMLDINTSEVLFITFIAGWDLASLEWGNIAAWIIFNYVFYST